MTVAKMCKSVVVRDSQKHTNGRHAQMTSS